MRIAELPIDVDPEKIAAFCRGRGIQKLSIFGSALRDDFDTRRSDIDLVVEYEPGRHPGLDHFRYQDELAAALGRKVDLNTPAMPGKHLRQADLAEAWLCMSRADTLTTLKVFT